MVSIAWNTSSYSRKSAGENWRLYRNPTGPNPYLSAKKADRNSRHRVQVRTTKSATACSHLRHYRLSGKALGLVEREECRDDFVGVAMVLLQQASNMPLVIEPHSLDTGH